MNSSFQTPSVPTNQSSSSKFHFVSFVRNFWPFPVTVVTVLIIWELSVRVFHTPNYLLPSPTHIMTVMISSWQLIGYHSGVTLYEALAGFVLGSIAGFFIACIMSYSRVCERLLYPFLLVSQTFPKEAMAPLLLVWLGFGVMPKITVAALISFFPVAINATRGLTLVDPSLVDLMRTLSASPSQVFFKLRLPHSLPYLFAGLKMAGTLSVIGAIVGEFVGASAGLGYLIQVGNSQLNTALVFAALFALGVITMGLFLGIEMLEKIALRRHEKVIYISGK